MQTRRWLATKEHLELVSQDQILERKILAGTTAINEDAKQASRGGPAPAREHIRAGRAKVCTILIDFCRPSRRPQVVLNTLGLRRPLPSGQAVGKSPHEMLGPLAGALRSGPWWTLTYQPPVGTE